MKKLICIMLSALMLLSVAAFVGCDKADVKQPALKMGLGVYTSTPSVTDATEEKDGKGNVAITAAVITVDFSLSRLLYGLKNFFFFLLLVKQCSLELSQ